MPKASCFLLSSRSLRHVFRELLAAENMEVKVLNRLATVITDVRNDAVAVLESELLRNFGDSGEYCRNRAGICSIDFISRCDMRLRHNEAVHGSLGIDVKEGVAGVILVNLL